MDNSANLDSRFETLYDAIFSLGSNFLSQGKYEKALIIFDGLISLDPAQKKAVIAYGETLLLAGNAEKALSHFFAMSKQFDLDSRTLLLTAKTCILLEKPEEAKKLLEMIIRREIDATQNEIDLAEAILSHL